MSQDKLLIFLIAFISLIAVVSFLASPYFQLHKITYQGLDVLNRSEIDEKIKSFYRTNILLINTRDIKRKLLNDGYISDIEVKRIFPDKMVINIRERKPLAKIINNGKYLVFSEEGYILEQGPLKSKINLPEINGIGYSLSGNKINFSPLLKELGQALAMIDKDTRTLISNITNDDGIINIKLHNQIPVYLGATKELAKKFTILQSVLLKIKREDLKIEYIDLSITKKPVIKLQKGK